jgi:hypothetical protein
MAVEDSEIFICRFSIPHFYPGLAEEELAAERDAVSVEVGAKNELKVFGQTYMKGNSWFVPYDEVDSSLVCYEGKTSNTITTSPSPEVQERAIKLAQTINARRRLLREPCLRHTMAADEQNYINSR